ncbi:hypothetical protein L1S34_07205 [Flavobacterium sp. K77]|uniref:hypothetical protein n=1 Tax=Flavobacterium sp. K77 TaxID=2910676 RepID=UPI001F372911|nr:hypothetical protein [Flavobacterium sp. K77]MCF6141068.1 hypothetical protein [Flavobacterium sp. K77]
MKSKIVTNIFFILILCSCNQKFEKLSEKNADTEALLKKIQPNKKVKYWQLEYFPNYKTKALDFEILFSKGNSANRPIPKNEFDLNGFFSGCQPSWCEYRIIYLENGKWKVIRSENELKNFIDKIDNVYEAFLIGKINNYEIDNISEKGNGFIKQKDGFTLNMMKYKSCPESKESFTFFVNNNGVIQDIENNGFYLKTKDCIVY